MSAAVDRFANQAMIVALAIAGRCVEQINAKIERPPAPSAPAFKNALSSPVE